MAIKSIIDVDVDPQDRLGAYVKRFKEYESALKKTPGIWGDAGKEVEAATTSFESGLAALLAMLDAAEQVKKNQKETKKDTDNVALSWKSAATWSKNFASNIANATLSLAKWVGIGSAISGLVGAGGLWGLNRMAEGFGAGRRSAQGLGLSFGEHRAFEVNLNRIVDTEPFLRGVNDALLTAQKRTFLFRSGLHPSDIDGKNTFQISLALLKSWHNRLQGVPDYALANIGAQLGADQFGMDEQALRRVRDTTELDKSLGQARKNAGLKGFGVDDKGLEQWQDFGIALDTAKYKIEAAFGTGLAPVIKQLPELSEALSGTIVDFLHTQDLKQDMIDFGGAIKYWAHEIGTPEFKADVKEFAHDVHILAEESIEALRLFGLIPRPKPTEKQAYDDLAGPKSPYGPGGSKEEAGDRFVRGVGDFFHQARLRYLERADRLPAGLLSRIYAIESGSGLHSGLSRAGALGPFQFMSATAKQYGVTDRTSFAQESNAAAHYLYDLMRRYHGDSAKAVAAYNWGPGNVDRDIARYGAAWRKHLPDETAKYLANAFYDNIERVNVTQRVHSVTHKVKSDVKVHIKISAQPGSNPIVNAATLSGSK